MLIKQSLRFDLQVVQINRSLSELYCSFMICDRSTLMPESVKVRCALLHINQTNFLIIFAVTVDEVSISLCQRHGHRLLQNSNIRYWSSVNIIRVIKRKSVYLPNNYRLPNNIYPILY